MSLAEKSHPKFYERLKLLKTEQVVTGGFGCNLSVHIQREKVDNNSGEICTH